MIFFDENEKLYYEDEFAKYYTSGLTIELTKYIREDDQTNGNKGLYRYFVLLAKKDNTKEYVIFNDKGMPVYANGSYEAICVQIDILKFANMG